MAAKKGRGGRRSAPILRGFKPGFRWSHVKLQPYKISANGSSEFYGASRQVLIGKGGERVAFDVRYFELEPGGFTSFERHRHSHVVIGVRGQGVATVGKRRVGLGKMDVVYIGPDEPHRLAANGRGKFGFLCIVDAHRDRPVPLTQ